VSTRRPQAGGCHLPAWNIQPTTGCAPVSTASTSSGDLIVEIKCPGWPDHQTAVRGRIPDKYYSQLQHLLAVSEAEICHYWSFREGRGVMVEVEPDQSYITRLMERESQFWKSVKDNVAPDGRSAWR
jgi:hypothetical protein